MTSRTQVTLDPELNRRVHERAADLGISFAEYVRRLVLRDLGAPAPPVRPDLVFNLGSTAGSDVSRNKDAMIAEAFSRPVPRQGRRRGK